MIRYSARARKAYARLYRPYNDIDVYVEDRTYAGVYERYINRVLAGRAQVTRVIPLGPRGVVEAAAEADTADDSRPRLYIVDGDLDVIAYRRQKSINRLHRLNVYSVENLFSAPAAMEDYALLACPALTSDQCLSQVAINALIDDVNENVFRYVVVLAIARRLKLRAGVFAFDPKSISTLVDGKYVGTDSLKLYGRLRSIIRACRQAVGIKKYNKAKEAVIQNIKVKGLTGLRTVPGKSFILWYLNERVGAARGVSAGQAIIVSHLARLAPLSIEPKLVRKLRSLTQ